MRSWLIAALTAAALQGAAHAQDQNTPPARPVLQFAGTSFDGFITYLDAGKALSGTSAVIWRFEVEETGAADLWRRVLVDCKASIVTIDWVVQIEAKTGKRISAQAGSRRAEVAQQAVDKITVREACSGKPLAANKQSHTSVAAAAADAKELFELNEEMTRDDSGGDPFLVNTSPMARNLLIERTNLALVRTTPMTAPATQNIFFVEISTIRRTGTIAEAWTLMALRARKSMAPGGGAGGPGLDGAWASARFECSKGTFQLRSSAAAYADGRTHSRENTTDQVRHVVTNPNYNAALEIACGRTSIQGAPKLASAAAAIASIRAPAPVPAAPVPRPVPPAPAPKPAPVATAPDLGPVVRIREASRRPGEPTYSATWTRRGTSNIYDGAWTFDPTGQRFSDVLEVTGVQNGRLIIRRTGNNGTYWIAVLPGGKLGKGGASWVSDADYYWEIVP